MTWLSLNKMISIETKVDTIDTIIDSLQTTQPIIVERATSNLPQGAPGQTAYFTVSGRILLLSIIGEVTEQIEAVAVSIKLVSDPTVGADVDLCSALVINGDVVGTIYTITGTLANPMVATTSGAVTSQPLPVVVTAGSISLNTDINATGKTKWTLHYVPIDEGSTVVAA